MVSARPIWMWGWQGEWGGVQQGAQCVTLSRREPHTTPSEAYLSCVCADVVLSVSAAAKRGEQKSNSWLAGYLS